MRPIPISNKITRDEVFNRGSGAIRYFLEQGYWNHAIRTSQIDSSPSVDPVFGFAFAFDLPSDYVRLVQIGTGENFTDPLIRYEIEAGFIHADIDPIFFRYVSDDADFGNDLSLWPESFTLWAGTWLGVQVAPTLKNDLDLKELRKEEKRLKIDARSKVAQALPPRWPPLSSWARARHGSNKT